MSMSWYTYICFSHHQPFVREISPWITLKRIRNAGLYCLRFISLNNFYTSEVPMIWYAQTLMWCPYYDKGVVNFDVTVLLISYTKIFCVKRWYLKKTLISLWCEVYNLYAYSVKSDGCFVVPCGTGVVIIVTQCHQWRKKGILTTLNCQYHSTGIAMKDVTWLCYV